MLLRVRRIAGNSMSPALRPRQIVVASTLFRSVKIGDIVIFRHQGIEKIKRIQAYSGDRIFVVGDNSELSTDSRQFGWIPRAAVLGRVIWPGVRPGTRAAA